jgi:hypothetical protein
MDHKNPTNMKKLLRLWMALIWTLVVLGIFYWAHKPVPSELVVSSLSPLIDVFVSLLVISLCGGLGRRLIKGDTLAPLERFGLQAALGAGILGIVWLLIGMVGGYVPWIAWSILFGLLLVFWRNVRSWWMELASIAPLWTQAGLIEKTLAAASGLLISIQLLMAFAPPTHWDALAYHLELPHLYLQAGRLIFVPYNLFWGNPQLGEMLFTLAMGLGRAQTATVFSVLFGCAWLLGVIGFTQHWSGELLGWDETTAARSGWVACIALLAGYTIRHQFAWGYVDILAAPMGLGLLICVFEWLKRRKDSWLNWAGVFLGLAVGVKYPSALLGLAVYLVILWKIRPLRAAALSVFRSGLISLAVFSPWLLKNELFTGNPLFPYLIPTVWASTLRVQAASLATSFDIPLVGNLLFPFSSVLMGGENGLWFGAEVGVLILWMGALGWWLYIKKVEGKMMTLALLFVWGMAAGLSAILWQFQQTRIYFAMLPVAGLMAGTGWGLFQSWAYHGIRLRRLLGVLLIFVAALTCWQDSIEVVKMSPLQPAMGLQPAQAYLEDNLGWYAVAMKSLKELPQGTKVIMLWEPRGLYAPDNAQPDVWIDTWRIAYWSYHSPDKIIESWRSQGFTHLIINQNGADMIREGDHLLDQRGWSTLDQTLKTLPKPESFGSVYFLYSIPRQ